MTVAALAPGVLGTGVSGAAQRRHLDVRLFARVPSPGAPAGVAVAADGTVYASTLNAEGNGDSRAPSKVFAYSPDGRLRRSFEIAGQNLSGDHGLTGLALDADGRLYAGELGPAQVLRIDPATGHQEVYSTLRDLAPCRAAPAGDCSPAARDLRPLAGYPVFGPDGSLYLTDSLQGVIWRIPAGGGPARVWLADARLTAELAGLVFGPSGMVLMPDHRTLLFTVAQPVGSRLNPASGRLWKVPILPDGRPGELTSFWESPALGSPDGIALARSGNLYLALPGTNQIAVVSPQGREIVRAPSPLENLLLEAPLDTPLGVAFHGDRLIVANDSFLLHRSRSWALLDVFTGEAGAPVLRPRIARRARERTSHRSRPRRPRRRFERLVRSPPRPRLR